MGCCLSALMLTHYPSLQTQIPCWTIKILIRFQNLKTVLLIGGSNSILFLSFIKMIGLWIIKKLENIILQVS
jgi:hypothetical protein